MLFAWSEAARYVRSGRVPPQRRLSTRVSDNEVGRTASRVTSPDIASRRKASGECSLTGLKRNGWKLDLDYRQRTEPSSPSSLLNWRLLVLVPFRNWLICTTCPYSICSSLIPCAYLEPGQLKYRIECFVRLRRRTETLLFRLPYKSSHRKRRL